MKFPDLDKRKHIGKILLTYAGGAWVIIQVINLIITQYNWSVAFLDVFILLFLFGLPAAFIYALYGNTITKRLKFVYGINIFLAVAFIGYYFIKPDSLHPNQIKFMKFKGDQKKIAKNIKSIANLPFANHTGNTLNDYLSASIHESLTLEIGSISSLRVISKTTTNVISKQEKSLQQIAKELNVDAVMEGSILFVNDLIRVNVSLINAFPQEMQLWSKEYSESLSSLVNVYSKITKNLAEEIELPLTMGEKSKLEKTKKVDPAAYEAYLKGKSSMGLLTEDGIKASIGYFERAIELDPSYAPAFAALGGIWGFLKQMNFVSTDEANLHLKPNIERAKKLDSTLSEVHYWEAINFVWTDFNWTDGEASFLKAIRLNPNSSETHGLYANFLLTQNRIEEARQEMDIALDLDPQSPFILTLNLINYVWERNFDKAIELGVKLQETTPSPLVNLGLFQSYALTKNYDKLIEQAGIWLVLEGHQEIVSILEKDYELNGFQSAFEKTCSILEQKEATKLYAQTMFSFYAVAGNEDKTLDWIEKSYLRMDPDIPALNTVPILDPYRNESRLKEIIARLKFQKP